MRGAADIAKDLARNVEGVCRAYLPAGHKNGHWWIVGDVHGSKGKSCTVRLTGANAGKWSDRNPANADHFGDLLDLIRLTRRLSMIEAMKEAESFLGQSPQEARVPSAMPERSDEDRLRAIRRLWNAGRALEGTKAARYLSRRGVSAPTEADLRFHTNVFYRDERGELCSGPCMLAGIMGADGAVAAIHRTWFSEDRALFRKMIGWIPGARIFLGGAGPTVVVGEGIETVLSIQPKLPDARLMSALSSEGLKLFEPPDDATKVIILQDNDEGGRQASLVLEDRLLSSGVDAEVWSPRSVTSGADFNDDLRAGILL